MGRLDIQIKLKRDFVSQYNKLQDKYGAYMARLNGFGGGQLSYNDFIDNFIGKDVVADASIDANSNVSSKDIVTLEREMTKPHKKLLAYNKIYYEMQKTYGFYNANKWLWYEWIGKLYMHDSDSSSFRSYCYAYSTKTLAEKGLYFLPGRNALPAKHLITFVDFIKEFVNYNSNRTSGAVGLPDLIPYMFYFWKKDVDNDYMGIRSSGNERYYADQSFQRFIYAVNQNFMRDSSQSAFTNTSVFDRPYFEALFGGSQFPDGTFMIDYEEEIMEFQKWYMEVMSNIRSECMFTFPVSTISLLKNPDAECGDDDFFVDKEFAYWAIRHNMIWSDSNLFIDDSVSSLSNCCFDGKQMVIIKTSEGTHHLSFKEAYDKYDGKEINILNDGKWSLGKVIKVPKKQMYHITTENGKELTVTEDHIHVTNRGDIPTTELTTDDFLRITCTPLDVDNVHEYLEINATLIAMFARFGNFYVEDGTPIGVNFAIPGAVTDFSGPIIEALANMDPECYNSSLMKNDNQSMDSFGGDIEMNWDKEDNTCYINIKSDAMVKYLDKYVKTSSRGNPIEFRSTLLDEDPEFRYKILTMFVYPHIEHMTVSASMVNSIDMLFNSVGDMITISKNGNEYDIQWEKVLNDTAGLKFVKPNCTAKNDKVYTKIATINKCNTDDEYVYCFEMKDQEDPYFTLANGIITHNCRLKSDITELYFNSIGGTALSVGSVKVGTVNLARIALETDNEDDYIKQLEETLWINLMALDRVRHIIVRNVEKGLLPNFTHGLIEFEHLYNTIGFIGVYETMLKYGYVNIDEFGNHSYTNKAYQFGERIFKTMRSTADKFIEKYNCDYKINTEQIPGESAADKLMKKDKFFYGDSEIYELPLYGNQFMPLGVQSTLQERINAHSKFDYYCNGGAILHGNVDKPFDSFEKALKATIDIARAGVTYFAFNTRIQACDNNHAFYGDTCPVCNHPVSSEYTRVVGFYTKISTWTSTRKEEYKLRKWV